MPPGSSRRATLPTCEGVRVVESYFDAAIRPRPPRGVVLFAPCSFNSLNKVAHGIADTLALSVVAEAIGRRTPVIIAPSLNQPLLDHPMAQASLATLASWGVTVVPPENDGAGPRLAPTRPAAGCGASLRPAKACRRAVLNVRTGRAAHSVTNARSEHKGKAQR